MTGAWALASGMVEVAPVTLHLNPCIYMFEIPQRRGTQSHAQVQPSGGQAGRFAGTSYVASRFHGVLISLSQVLISNLGLLTARGPRRRRGSPSSPLIYQTHKK